MAWGSAPCITSQVRRVTDRVSARQRMTLNLTSADCPWVLSGNILRMIDPQKLYQNKDFKTWDLTKLEDQREWSDKPHQKEPWQVGGLISSKSYHF